MSCAIAGWLAAALLHIPAALGAGAASQSAAAEIVGEAFLAGSDQLAYREYLYRNTQGHIHRVVYELPDGSLLAEKTLAFGEPLSQPSFRQQNYFTGRVIGVDVVPAESAPAPLQVAMYHHATGEAMQRTLAPVSDQRSLVIDAGFDPFIRSKWYSLLQGQKQAIQFPLASSGRLLDMVVAKTRCADGPAQTTCFRIYPDSMLLNLLLRDPVHLVYENSGARLLTYRGVGNVALADGQLPRVEIHYRYPDEPDAAAQMTVIEAAQ
ncbi:hypothetical protein G8764_02165 [Pseudomaricurvus alcaniphilus]|uniref:hypothetical protein n=1 Tax=Pseudomaricurvus alcaniphilus TaxID=1166482 RepID=UPI00140D5C34|nr:hypothetical protein [Pseudomaricurvus alcaniphilus]NHN36093.1 hypothetical protein [Pseudomaricurvus alcaniphilus]